MLNRFPDTFGRSLSLCSHIVLYSCLFGSLLLALPHAHAAAANADADGKHYRVRKGLQVYYDFASTEGALIEDRAGVGQPIDLRIADPRAVRRTAGRLQVKSKTTIRSDKPATRLIRAVKRSGEITIEAWIQSASLELSGPARIVTLSPNTGERNFTLGQDGDKIDVRLRTDKTNTNGIPSLGSKPDSLKSALTHVAYSHSRAGQARIYFNGKLAADETRPGGLGAWADSYHLALANELSNDRPWLGTYRGVAIYSRALSPREVAQNFRAGPQGQLPPESLVLHDAKTKLFETKLAPLISKHCLECHDASTKQGGLNLAQKAQAMAGGDSGPAIVPGKSANSLLWQLVESNDMPRDRSPLSAQEKALLKKWIDDGATWSLQMVDPAVYVHAEGPQKLFVQRLTVPEYIETVRSTAGVDIAQEVRELLPRDQRADGFSNTAYNLNVDLAHVEAYARLAEIVVSRMDVKALGRKYTKSRELTDENIKKVIEPFGRLLLRGPLSKDEITLYCGVSTSVAGGGGNFDEALALVLEAMLQSPRFLYRIESQRGDGSAMLVAPYELASRLSYILWGGPPDRELLNAAEKGNLDRAGVRSQVERMLKDRRAVERSRQFVSEWLNLGRLDSLRPSPSRFPNWNARLAADMREETLTFFEEIAWKQNRPLSDLFNAKVTFVTPRLARHYGLPPAAASEGEKAVRYDLSSVPSRGGLLTQGSVLTIGGDQASTVTRGLFVMHELARGVVRDPPPCVDTTPVPAKPGLSKRAIAELRLANKSCTGCHAKFEPLAFGLEKFDGLGVYHETDEHGNKLRDDGSILFPGQEKPVAFRSSAELMELLAGSERVRESLTWKVMQFALGRPLGALDAPIVAEIHRESQENGGTYASLLTAIVLSDLVQMTRTEATSPVSDH